MRLHAARRILVVDNLLTAKQCETLMQAMLPMKERSRVSGQHFSYIPLFTYNFPYIFPIFPKFYLQFLVKYGCYR